MQEPHYRYLELRDTAVTEQQIKDRAAKLEQGGRIKIILNEQTILEDALLWLEYAGFDVDKITGNEVEAIKT